MRLGIYGLPNSGKTTVFNALTGLAVEAGPVVTASLEPHIGMVRVPDRRIDHLARIYQPKKTTFADIELIDLMGIVPGGGDASLGRRVLNQVRDVQGLLQVVRGFASSQVPAYENRVAPVIDVDLLEMELLFADLELVERRLERIVTGLQKGQDKARLLREQEVLERCRAALEDEKPLRDMVFTGEEQLILNTYQFLSQRPELVVLNLDEDSSEADSQNIVTKVKERLGHGRTDVIALSARVEMEISQLDAEDRQAFMDDLGIEVPALELVVQHAYQLLGLIPFFTVGKDEVKAWTIEMGTTAVKAAGKIHSDIERGFIRAEVLAYDDFVACNGDFVKAKETGKLRLEGKEYVVQDGDIINFRFNV
ncbi:MAG: redox-regulated ATPase YchF [Deltaproteobacteria bacterium]|nr:redox-regulated ATPase YchF [Candidatus Anaeroferrophillus wilburensis]MBN2888668.1 redox-regulated ATPase YchF [Deltaproteobacteria bacterium]